MTKKKPVKVLLLLVVVAIWGIVGYQVLNAGAEPDNDSTYIAGPIQPVATQTPKDVLPLDKSYADPFFKKMAYQPTRDRIQPVAQRAKPVKNRSTKPQNPWPPVVYNGTVKNHTTGNLYAFFEINGRKEALVEQEEFESVKVLRIWKDSVLLKFEDQERMVRKY